MKLYILTYNNYFNRKLLKLDNISDYEQYVVLTADNISFNPNDGRQTTQVLNKYEKGDYLICTETKDEVESIVSRWFILEANRTRQGQYNLSLKRDVLADNLDSILNAPMFIEKAMLQDTDKMIVNNEGMQFNQIKTNEILLKDKSNCPWIVGYVAKNFAGDGISVNYTPDVVVDYVTLSQIATATGIDEDILADNLVLPSETKGSKPLKYTENFKIEFDVASGTSGLNFDATDLYIDGDFLLHEYHIDSVMISEWHDLLKVKGSTKGAVNALGDKIIEMKDNIISQLKTTFNRSYYVTSDQLSLLKQYNGKTIFYLGNYYILNVEQMSLKDTQTTGAVVASSLGAFTTAIQNASYPTTTTIDLDAKARITIQDSIYEMRAYAIESSQVSATITSARKTLAKEQFDMFAIPALDTIINADVVTFVSNADITRKIVNKLVTQADANVYDIQLLPYCPFQDKITKTGYLDISEMVEDQDYNYIKAQETTQTDSYVVATSASLQPGELDTYYQKSYTFTGLTDVKVQNVIMTIDIEVTPYISEVTWTQSGDTITIKFAAKASSYWSAEVIAGKAAFRVYYTHTVTDYPVGIILWASDNQFKVKLDYSLSLTHSMKVESQVDTYRLCSPNYQGSFDFNVAKNGGKVECFYADCTYKPYTPYIRVYPKFDWLYGQDYSDCRGLICGGDFSLPRVNDAWASYQLNNKNYQNIFNRDIQNLDFNNSIAMRNQAFSAISGIVSDTAKGAASGAMMGGGFGAIAGAVVGGAASTVGAVIDTDTLARQQREQKQLSIDKYNYQLGNIQALPYTLTKVGAFDINSKLYPFIEYYTASNEEIQTLEDKITYESMTVMRIGTISEFKQDDPTYIKGQLIRLDNFHEDTNLVNDIYTELYKGVYY